MGKVGYSKNLARASEFWRERYAILGATVL